MTHAIKDDRPRRGYTTMNGRPPPVALKIGSIMLSERDKKHWVNGIAKRVGTAPASAFSIFRSFYHRGWVDCEYEKVCAYNESQPPRVLYSLTADGVVAIRDALIPFQHAPVST